MKFKNVIFDFDGTLVDSRPGIVDAFKNTVKTLTNREVKIEEIVKLIGTPLAPMLEELLKTEDREIIKKGADLFRRNYSQRGVYNNIVYPGIKEMLASLKSFKFFIVSNKIERFIKIILEQHDIEKYFSDVIGTDGTDSRSSKTEYIKNILRKFNVKKEETIMIGDTDNDIKAAQENSVFSIGVTWGYGPKDSLAGANKIFNSPSDLRIFLKK